MEASEKPIELKKCYNETGKHMGTIVIYPSQLTTEFIACIKADLDNKMGWKQHRKVMKEKGYDID